MPFYQYQFESPYPPEDAVSKLLAITGEPKDLWTSIKSAWRAPQKTFIGKIENGKFHLHRDIRYRNSFLPQISGSIVPNSGSGSTISVTMRLHPTVILFGIFWLFLVGTIGWLTWNSGGQKLFTLFSPLGMILFFVAMILLGFVPEAIKAKRLIEKAINGKNA